MMAARLRLILLSLAAYDAAIFALLGLIVMGVLK